MEHSEYRLLKYSYKYFVQGSEEHSEEYALIHCFKDASFNNVRSTLFNERYKEYTHEIDIESVKDLTIKW